MIVVRRLVPLSLVVVVLLGVIAVTTAAPKAGGVLKVALLRDPTGWDPHINYGATTYSFQNNVYEQLVRYSAKGVLEPALAVRWETPDPRTYVLHLRKNVRFHSGNPFTAEDVKFSIERILDPNTNATRAREFAVVQSVEVVDPHTVRIALKQPSAPFLDMLAAGRDDDRGREVGAGGRGLQEGDERDGSVQGGPLRDRRPLHAGQEPGLLGGAAAVPRPHRAGDDRQGRAARLGAPDRRRGLRRVHPLAGDQRAREGPGGARLRRLRHLQRDPPQPEAAAVRQPEGPPGVQLPGRPQGDHGPRLGRDRAALRRRPHPRRALGVPARAPVELEPRPGAGQAAARRGRGQPGGDEARPSTPRRSRSTWTRPRSS